NQDGFFDGDTLFFFYHDETGDSLLGPLTFNYSNNPEWNSSELLFIGTTSGVNLSTNPQITLTPQETMEDIDFNTINLTQIVSDPDDDPAQIIWSFSGNEILDLNVENNVLTIEVLVPDWHGTENIQFIAIDSHGGADSLFVPFTVLPVNDLPFVDAGDDLQVNENETIQLNGTGGDIEGNVSFQWTGDSMIQFIDPDDPLTELISPEVNADTDFIITLTVTDSSNVAVSDSLILTVFNLGNTDIINFNPNWNLISFDIMMENMHPEIVFSDIINDDNLVFIT
ncbi:uncharacterized protein METZ01_LOCUS402717, partial [marine metagenome]